jgi:hypothetical protein
MGAVLLAASALTLGLPNLNLAGQFLGGAYPSMASALAFLSLLCYAVVLAAVVGAVVRGLRAVAGGRDANRGLRAVVFVIVGAVLLTMSVINRVDSGGGICCGEGAQQIQEAASLAR